jgi:vitamin B12 transporter
VRDDIRINEVPFAAFAGSEVDRIPDEIRGGELGAVYTWSRRESSWAKGFRTLVGFDFKDRWVRDFGAFVFPGFASTTTFSARRQEYAGYIEQEASLFDGHLLATGGFRVDGNSQFGKEVSPSWSVAIPIEKISTTLRGSYSEGFRAPSFNELDFPGFGNPNLKPEISSEYDGGFTTTFGEMAWITTTYFSRRVHDLIVTVPCTVGPGCEFGATAGNAGRVDTQGVEFVPSITVVKGLTFGGNVTVLDETHANGPGATARPLRVAKHTASALVQYVRSANFLPNDRVTASVNYIFVGDRDDITPEGSIANHNAYHRVDAVASYALGTPLNFVHNEEVFARVTNMMDRTYSEAFGFKAPPVTFLAGVKLDFE